LQQRKQMVALIDGIEQSKITEEQAFFIDEKSPASILFDATEAEAYLAALEEQEHITDFYIVTQENQLFKQVKREIQELLGPVLVEEEEKRPLSEGFAANLEYFKLDFLDPNEVAMGRQFEAILPILWMMAGAKGKRPESNGKSPYLIPDK
jgi:adenine-specific DNA-methyltransferase